MRPVERRARAGEAGFILLVTLWVLVILGVLLTHLGYQVRAEAQVERRALNLSQLRWAARGAIHMAAARVREHLNDDYHSPIDEWWSDETLYHDLLLGQARVSLLRPSADESPAYGLDDEESRLNINIARPEHLMGFAGISSLLAEDIVLFRLRLEDEQRQQSEQRPASDSAEPQRQTSAALIQGPIRSLRELLAVEGVSEELLFTSQDGQPPLAELLTTVSSGKININTASAAILTALGINDEELDNVLVRRQETPFTTLDELSTLLAGSADSEQLERLQKILTVRSSTFRLRARASLAQQPKPYHIEATLASGAEALSFIRWQEY